MHLVYALRQIQAVVYLTLPWQIACVNVPTAPCASSVQVALSSAGISADGVGHLSPLAISVRQQNLQIVRLLLRYGVLPSMPIAGLPMLLHFHEAVAAVGSLGRTPATLLAGQPASLSRAASLTASGGDGGVTSGMHAGGMGEGSSSQGSDLTAMMQVGAALQLQPIGCRTAPPGPRTLAAGSETVGQAGWECRERATSYHRADAGTAQLAQSAAGQPLQGETPATGQPTGCAACAVLCLAARCPGCAP